MARPPTDKPRTPFAHRLVQVREAYGTRTGRPDLDRGEFAFILGVGGEAYRRYERGETEPKIHTLKKIREITGTPLDWLICGIEDRPARPQHPNVRVLKRTAR